MKRPSRRERERMSVEELEQLLEEYNAALKAQDARILELEKREKATMALLKSLWNRWSRPAKANTDANESGG